MHSEDDNVAFIARLRAGSLDQLADRLQDEWDNGFQVAAVTWGDLRALADLPSSVCGPVEQSDRDAQSVDQQRPKDYLEDGEQVSAHRLDRVRSVIVGTLLPYDESEGERVRDDAGVVWAVEADSVLPCPATDRGDQS